MIRKLGILLSLLIIPFAAHGQATAPFSGFCTPGSANAFTSGMKSANFLQSNIPQCTVTVYIDGTTNLATLYKDQANTPLSNPFTASTTGFIFFYTASPSVDVMESGGIPPNTFPFPVTYLDYRPFGSAAGVTQILAGTHITITPTTGVGVVTVNSTGGINTINNDPTSAQILTGGANITIVDNGTGGHTISASGGSLTGTILPGGPLNDVVYPAGSAGTIVGPASNSLTEPLNRTTAQLNTDFSTANIRVHLQNGDAHTPFVNSSHHDPVIDDRSDVPAFNWNVKASGAQCDAVSTSGTFTSGSQTITGHTGSSTAIGKIVMAVAPVAGVPTSFISKVASLDGSNRLVLTSQAPFTTSSGWVFTIGHDDSAALADAFNFGYTTGIAIALPEGKCLSSTTQVFDGANIFGQGISASGIIGPAGMDTLEETDPTNSGFKAFKADQHMADFSVYFDAEIDATQPWTACVDAGSGSTPVCTAQTPLYRPLGVNSLAANNPATPQWIQGSGPYNGGAINGVANTTSSSAAICVPNSTRQAIPSIGQQIIFPYQGTGNAAFSTTVSSTAGSCGTGFTPLTLAATWPGATLTGPQYVAAQEWFAGTSIQTIATPIPAASGRTNATLTAYTISGTSFTGTGTNSFINGQIVILNGFATSTFLNGVRITVASSSGSSFTGVANITHTASATEGGVASPFPMVVTLANPIVPTPEYSLAGLAAYGYVKLQTGEECSYYGNSNYLAGPAVTPSITLTACGQNGTTVAAHSIGEQIFPLNPLQPTWPYPVTPNLNTNTTPTNAEYFPGPGMGNAAISFPNYDGSTYSGNESPYNAVWRDVAMSQWPIGISAPQNPTGYQVQNDTGCLYIVPLPFHSTFENLFCVDSYYGIAEGTPSINTWGYFSRGFPTANGNRWTGFFNQSSAYPLITIGGQNEIWQNATVFSEAAAPPNNVWPGFPIGYSGAQATWLQDGPWSDRAGGVGNVFGMEWAHFQGFYTENEFSKNTALYYPATQSLGLTQPLFLFNCNTCSYTDMGPNSGGVAFVGGQMQIYHGGVLLGGVANPIVNYGKNNTFDKVSGMNTTNPGNNIWGLSSFLNLGPGTAASAPAFGTNGVIQTPLAGNSRQPVMGQTAETFGAGNISLPFVNALQGYITPDEFNTSSLLDASPFTVGWTFDDTAPISHSYAACSVPTSGGCSTYQWNAGGRIYIGPDNSIPAAPTSLYAYFKTPAGANTFTLTITALNDGHASCSAATVYTGSVTTTGTGWQEFGPVTADFTGKAGCVLNAAFTNASSAASVQVAFLDFYPIAQNSIAQNTNILNQVNLAGIPGISGQCVVSGGSGSPTVWGACGSGGTGPGAANEVAIYTGTNTIGGDALLNDNGASGGLAYTGNGASFVDSSGGGSYELNSSGVGTASNESNLTIDLEEDGTSDSSANANVRAFDNGATNSNSGNISLAAQTNSTGSNEANMSFQTYGNSATTNSGNMTFVTNNVTPDSTNGNMNFSAEGSMTFNSRLALNLRGNPLIFDLHILGVDAEAIVDPDHGFEALDDASTTNGNAYLHVNDSTKTASVGFTDNTGTHNLALNGTVSTDHNTLDDGAGNAVFAETLALTAIGSSTSPLCTTTGGVITNSGCGSGGGGVSSVSFTGPGGIYSVTGSPITSSGVIALSVTGISGGTPYFSGPGTLSSSAVLPVGDFMLGGGAGAAPTATFSVVPTANGGSGTGSTLTGIIRGGNPFTASELSGDATTSGSNAVTVAKVNGTTVPTNSAANQTLITTSTAVSAWTSIPSCSGATNGITFNTTTHAFGCNTLAVGGNTTSTALTGQYLPIANGTNSIINSQLDEGFTTPNVLTVHDTGGMNILGTGAGSIGLSDGASLTVKIIVLPGVPTTGCGSTYPNSSLYLNSTGTAGSTFGTGSLLYSCDATSTTWKNII